MTSSPSLTTAPLPLSGQSGIGWSIRRPSPGRPGDGRHDQLGNFQTALLGRITPASTAYVPLSFAPGEAYQFDWSHEVVLLSGVTVIVKVAHVRLCHIEDAFKDESGACCIDLTA